MIAKAFSKPVLPVGIITGQRHCAFSAPAVRPRLASKRITPCIRAESTSSSAASPMASVNSGLQMIPKEAATAGILGLLALQAGSLVADLGSGTPIAVAAGVLLQSVLLYRLVGLVSQQDVYTPQGVVKAHVWTDTTSPNFVYPELSDTEFGIPDIINRPNLGICVSGGGMRATTMALGWVRALYQMGVLQQARYLSSNSGGSWFNGAMSYTEVPLDKFFGPYLPPEQLTLKELKNIPAGSYGAAVSQWTAPIKDIAVTTLWDAITKDRDGMRAWSTSVGNTFLKPFGLMRPASSITAMGTRGNVHERVMAQASNIPFAKACTQGRPYPILVGSVILPHEPETFFPFEFTPLYYGDPAVHHVKAPCTLGGGYIEPLGFNSSPPAEGGSSPDGSKVVEVTATASVGLVQCVGVSSSFVAQKNRGGDAEKSIMLSVEQFDIFNMVDFTGAKDVSFGDGGGHDNQAMTPLLRRGVENIIACSANQCDAVKTNQHDWAAYQWDVAGLFGAIPEDSPAIDGVPAKTYNRMMQVFPKEKFDELYNGLVAALKAGKPPAVSLTMEVLPNSYMGIKGNYTVNVLYVLNGICPTWEKALPAETKKMLDKARKGDSISAKLDEWNQYNAFSLREFPLIDTMALSYTEDVTQMLSQYCSWVVKQCKGEIDNMLASSSKKTESEKQLVSM